MTLREVFWCLESIMKDVTFNTNPSVNHTCVLYISHIYITDIFIYLFQTKTLESTVDPLKNKV